MWRSTRGSIHYSSSEAILKGLADDGGLFILDSLLKIDFNDSWINLEYSEIAKKILAHFFVDFTCDEIDEIVSKTYSKENFKEDVIKLKSFDTHCYLELYHGPTLAFKDMALTMLPHLMEIANRKINYAKKLIILTATSGDTGGAALSGFSKSSNIETVVLYPNSGVSPFQEKQMLSFTNSRAKAFAVDNNFDECQKMVKELFLNNKDSNIVLSSANSINIGRLVPQIIYYFAGYLEMVKCGSIRFGEEINVCVPTGNFGNILASYYAKEIGLPIKDFICASNENNVLTDFFTTGVYDSNRTFYKTNSPSMDILVSSNLERLIASLSQNTEYVCKLMDELKTNKRFVVSKEIREKLQSFNAFYLNSEETKEVIKNVYDNYNYLIDPHTAVAKGCFDKYEGNGCKTMIVSTASPLKFSETVCDALGIEKDNPICNLSSYTNLKLNENIMSILNDNNKKIVMKKDDIYKYLFNNSFEIRVPATSANIACAFDVAGISLNIFNKYHFILDDEFSCVNFSDNFNNPLDNLIIKSYKYVFEKVNKKFIPVKVIEISNEIPVSRGLGSSASLILAGVLAACYILNIDDDCFIVDTLVELEGHPDNVVPAYLGGFVASYKLDGKYNYVSYPVSSKLKFMIAYPPFKVSTKDARCVLPNKLEYSDIVFDLSRVIHLPKALGDGNLELLKDILVDKIHEPYRLSLIDEGEKIIAIAKNNGYACCISGSGSSILFIGYDYKLINIFNNYNLKNDWKLLKCEINFNKTKIFGGR